MEFVNKPKLYILCFSPYFGGMELDSLKLAKLLHTIFSVRLVIRAHTKLSDHCNDLVLPFAVTAIDFWGSFDPRCIWELRNLWKHDTEKSHVLFLGASELKSIYFALNPKQTCIIRHGTTKHHPKKDWFHRWLYKKVTHHVTLGEHLKQNVLAIFPGPKTCHIVRPSCLLPQIVHRPKAIPRILIFGRIIKEKGVWDGLVALANLFKKGIAFELTIQGPCDDNNLLNELKEFIEKNGLTQNVVFLPASKDVIAVYQAHDYLLFPSYGEGFPNTLVEALWCGLYPIVYNNTCFPEFRELGFDLQIAENKNTTDLTAKMEIALQNRNENNNQQLAFKLFAPEREQKDWQKLINQES
jgi:glycosyltransferase involved in cell wall biosynthesis